MDKTGSSLRFSALPAHRASTGTAQAADAQMGEDEVMIQTVWQRMLEISLQQGAGGGGGKS